MLSNVAGTLIRLSEVIFGDVWMCAGQSNMEMKMKEIMQYEEEINNSAGYNIRFTDMKRATSRVRII